ncbi:MAG: aminodeoxychorismate synthase component 1 [Sideroxydans sp.]
MPVSEVPFAGGALGYWGYDLARYDHRLPSVAQAGSGVPDMAVGIYNWALVLDHRQRHACLVSHLADDDTRATLSRLQAWLISAAAAPSPTVAPFQVHGEITFNMGWPAYRSAFDTIQRLLSAGDCYQVNLARRFFAPASGDAYTLYRAQRRLSPAPFSAFLEGADWQVVCASPERFLQVRQGCVETRPIKGTRPRSDEGERDAELARELRNHPKDRAENLMIVDLLRNDLGKCCVPGSVQAKRLFEIESYSHVHHLVSTISGRLRPDQDALDLLRACFPGGSITGAPKQRAMEIIEQLEPHRRGVYCGAIGYLGFDGNMDTNIAIRTLVHAGGEICGWAGGGIVADSQCEAEFRETEDKAAAMLNLLRQFANAA